MMNSTCIPISPSELYKCNNRFEAELNLPCYELQITRIEQRYHCDLPEDASFPEVNVLKVPTNDNSEDNLAPLYVLDPSLFKPSSDSEEMKKTLSNLSKFILKAGSTTHNYFNRNGSNQWGPKGSNKFTKYKFICKRSRISNAIPTNDSSVKTSSTNNNRKKHTRSKGHVQMRRRTSSALPQSATEKCSCSFWMYSNDNCFFFNQLKVPSIQIIQKLKFIEKDQFYHKKNRNT